MHNGRMESKAVKLARLRVIGRLGGLVGGPARHLALGHDRRSEIARLAAEARWRGKIAKAEKLPAKPKDWTA